MPPSNFDVHGLEQSIQMYIIAVECYKCNQPINVAVIKSEDGFRGPETFKEGEKQIADSHGVVIKLQHTFTRQESYDANTCPHCNTFIGQHFLFTDYFVAALNGDYKYDVIEIP